MSFFFKKDSNWKKLEKMLSKENARKIVKAHVRRATLLNGKILEKKMRDSIKEGKFLANAPLTEAIKKDNKPLVGVETGATLFKAITSIEISTGSFFNDAVFVGVLRTNEIYNIAKSIHDGVKINVTPKMRGLFLALSAVSQGKLDRSSLSQRGQDLYDYMSTGWKPLSPSTTKIIIPPREFVKEAFKDPSLRALAKKNWQKALQMAFTEIRTL